MLILNIGHNFYLNISVFDKIHQSYESIGSGVQLNIGYIVGHNFYLNNSYESNIVFQFLIYVLTGVYVFKSKSSTII